MLLVDCTNWVGASIRPSTKQAFSFQRTPELLLILGLRWPLSLRVCGLHHQAFLWGGAGPSIKYLNTLQTKRIVWASPAFRAESPAEWLLLLEIVSSSPNRWHILNTTEEWAAAKATAEAKGRSSQVLALVVSSELVDGLKHVFTLLQFLKFVQVRDLDRGSIGLLNM